jgi:hypothetical protein
MNRSQTSRTSSTRLMFIVTAAVLMQAGSGVALAQGQGGAPNAQRQHDSREQKEQRQSDRDPRQRGSDDAPGRSHGPGQVPGRSATPPAPGRSNDNARAPSHGNNANAHVYALEQQDRARLKRHYQRVLGHVDRAHRPHFEPGHIIPVLYRPYITLAPLTLRRHLPPLPPGYVMGYYQGYSIVYDPTTFAIITIVDLLLLQ